MSWFIVALFVGVPTAVWVYNKSMGRTGNNTQTSIIAGIAVGFLAFIMTATLYSFID